MSELEFYVVEISDSYIDELPTNQMRMEISDETRNNRVDIELDSSRWRKFACSYQLI
jgi:hypothetical protein